MELEKIVEEDSRKYGLDVLRILAIYMVVMLHVLYGGRFLEYADNNVGTIRYYFIWLLECLVYCAVDVLGILSGILGWSKKKQNYKRVIMIWLQTLFYSFVFTSVFFLFHPELFDYKVLLNSLMPISQSYYWYITAYIGVMVLSPMINKGIQLIDRKRDSIIVLSVLFWFSIVPIFTKTDSFILNNGYSTIFLCALYVIGGYIGKYKIYANRKMIGLLIYFSMCIFTFVLKIKKYDIFLNYHSITIIMSAIGLCMFFNDVSITRCKKLIKVVASGTLGVFLVQSHPLVRTYYWPVFADNDTWILRNINIVRGCAVNNNSLILGVCLLLFGVLIFSASFMIETVRISFFRLLRVEKLVSRICILLKIVDKEVD